MPSTKVNWAYLYLLYLLGVQAVLTGNGQRIGPWLMPFRLEGVTEIRCQLGPAGPVDRGYTAYTGRQTYGIVWWCNGLMAPEIVVERGRTYLFLIEGGSDWTNPNKFHPMYITDDPDGGYVGQDSALMNTRVYAGIGRDYRGFAMPLSFGRYCEWKFRDFEGTLKANQAVSFDDYRQYLNVDCEPGPSGRLIWTPDLSTPDTLYYQSYTRANMGYKIRVVGRDPAYLYDRYPGYPYPYPGYPPDPNNQFAQLQRPNSSTKLSILSVITYLQILLIYFVFRPLQGI